jgi:very-short-patch-repair endonuclease
MRLAAPKCRVTTLSCVSGLIRRQYGVITLAQLYAAGISPAQVRTLVRHGRLRRLHRGVYAVEGAPPTPRRAAMAAVLACGHRAALSHVSAACHWRLLDHWPSVPQVTVASTTGSRGPKGIELHHARNRLQAVALDHIPTTTLARTLHDIVDRPYLRAAVRQAERLHRLDLATLEATGRLKAFLATYVSAAGTANDFEADFLALCARHGIPLPLREQQVGPYFPDFLWPAHRLIVETDGRGSHDTYTSFRDDRVRSRFLQQLGYVVLQFTYEEVYEQPRRVASELTTALARRRPPKAARRA